MPTQNERDGQAGWGGGAEPILSNSWSQSRTSVKDAHPWKLYTPPGIHVYRQCDVMYVCHSIRRTDRDNVAERTAVDIKAHTPFIRFVVDVLLVCCN